MTSSLPARWLRRAYFLFCAKPPSPPQPRDDKNLGQRELARRQVISYTLVVRPFFLTSCLLALTACGGVCPDDIHRACARKGCADKVKILLAKDASLAAKPDGAGKPPLHYAADTDIAEALLKAGADINVKAGANQTSAMFAALELDRGPVAKYLMDHGAERPYDMQYALAQAIKDGRVSSAQALIESGASATHVDSATGVTPLHTAALNDRVEIAKLLISKGANVNATLLPNVRTMSFGPSGTGTQMKTDTSDASGATPLMLARSAEMRDLLRAHGAH